MNTSFDSTTLPDNPLAETHSRPCMVCEAPTVPGNLLCSACDSDPRHDLEAIVAEMAERFPAGALARTAREIARQHGLDHDARTALDQEVNRRLSRQFEAFNGRASRPRTERVEEV